MVWSTVEVAGVRPRELGHDNVKLSTGFFFLMMSNNFTTFHGSLVFMNLVHNVEVLVVHCAGKYNFFFYNRRYIWFIRREKRSRWPCLVLVDVNSPEVKQEVLSDETKIKQCRTGTDIVERLDWLAVLCRPAWFQHCRYQLCLSHPRPSHMLSFVSSCRIWRQCHHFTLAPHAEGPVFTPFPLACWGIGRGGQSAAARCWSRLSSQALVLWSSRVVVLLL